MPRRLLLRRRVFVGCEGESERAYVNVLGHLLDREGKGYHLDAVVLQPGGGDPMAIVDLANKKLIQRQIAHGRYFAKAVFLDSDTVGKISGGEASVNARAKSYDIHLVWQRPCHEAMLLRYMPGRLHDLPATSAQAMENLMQEWPSYRKGMPARSVLGRVDIESVARAVHVETELRHFLRTLGLSNC